jgi:uncharacterized membrane protein YphA (DoxX/SURF4 family)
MMDFDKLKNYGPAIVRIGVSLVFLYFGISQLVDPFAWTGWVPGFVSNIINANLLVHINGIAEIVLGLLLIAGIFTRIAALLLALHLYGIAATIGFNPIGARDFGLATATLSVFFSGTDILCLENMWKKNI